MNLITGKPLAQLVLNHLAANPDLHDQSEWATNYDEDGSECGTTACLAGWTVLLADPDFDASRSGADLDQHLANVYQQLKEDGNHPGSASFPDVASVLLGLDASDMSPVWYCSSPGVAKNRYAAFNDLP